MPELPEVETIRKQLNKVLKGKEVAEIEVLREKSFITARGATTATVPVTGVGSVSMRSCS